jgi:hypothetical protein
MQFQIKQNFGSNSCFDNMFGDSNTSTSFILRDQNFHEKKARIGFDLEAHLIPQAEFYGIRDYVRNDRN